VQVIDAPINSAADLLLADREVDAAYRRLLVLLFDTSAPRQNRVKASPLFVYDQTELQRLIRSQLRGLGYTRGRQLSADTTYDGVRIPGFQADMIGHGLHVILEFGNRASWAHNLVTRVLGGIASDYARLSVVVAPTDAFARRIDTNLGTFERIASSLKLIERWRRESLPGPILVVGVTPDPMAPE
jgi:hypothetical protein